MDAASSLERRRCIVMVNGSCGLKEVIVFGCCWLLVVVVF